MADRKSKEGQPKIGWPSLEVLSGGVLLSHTVPRAVPSALKGLASGFGMEPGVSLSLWPPKLYGDIAEAAPLAREPSRPYLGNRTVDAYAIRRTGGGSSLWSSPRPISTG